ncbi:MAG TPA: hypothetical protein VK843_13915 [Planctomycetota bacterium]|nr:hypothetical protein [Planctomycetota bacterium]
MEPPEPEREPKWIGDLAGFALSAVILVALIAFLYWFFVLRAQDFTIEVGRLCAG